MDTAAIILAAGEGTRMKSKKPKVAHEILGKPLINWVIDSAKDAGIQTIVSVVGHKADQVIPLIEDDCEYVFQKELLGTADAVKCALASESLKGFEGSIVLLYGDCPLITSDTISKIASVQQGEGASCVLLTMVLGDPFGYGRIVRDGASSKNAVLRIVEQKDANEEEAAICECNSGIYCFDANALKEAIEKVENDNAQSEFYITDVIEIMGNDGLKCIAYPTDDIEECLGINSRFQLSEATAMLQGRINRMHMDNGVTIVSPLTTWISPDVAIEPDVVIRPNVELVGKTSIGQDSIVGPNTRLSDTVVGRACRIDETIAYESIIEDEAECGPRAYLRPGAHLCRASKAGTHVEIKKSTIGEHSKVPHLSYIGDTTIGKNVNIGAGSITCNYDGKNKNSTTIGDDTFVGSDTMMVAPLNIGSNVTVGAGSVLTRDVPDGALAIGRAREKLIDGWSEKHMK